jgi:CysZ protein
MTGGMAKRFLGGASAFFRGMGTLLGDRKLRLLTLAPVAITVVAAIGAAAAAWHLGGRLVASVSLGHGPVVQFLLELVLIVAVVLAAIAGYLCAGLVATAPFAEPLSERAEHLARGRATPHAPVPFLTGAIRDVSQTLVNVVVYLAFVGALFVVQLGIPVLAPVEAAVGFAGTAWFLAKDAFDPSLSRHGLDLAARRAFMKAHRPEAFGLGLAAALVALVPIVGLLVPPASVVAAAFLHAKLTGETGET